MLQLNQTHVVRAVQTVAVRTDEDIVERAVFAALENIGAVRFFEHFGRFFNDQGLAQLFGFALGVAPLNRHIAQPRHVGIDFVIAPLLAGFVNLLINRIIQNERLLG